MPRDHANATGVDLHVDLRIKAPVRAAATGNITLTAPGAVIDGVTMSAGDRFLAAFQSTASQCGIYVWNGAASAATRATDADSASDFVEMFKVGVLAGTTYAGTYWTYSTTGAITLGTTSLVFTRDNTVSGTFTGEVQATDFKPTGLTGSTAASRYVGATTSGAPTTGAHSVGDFVIDQTGKLWICTTAGTPGTWTQVSGGGSSGGGAGSLVAIATNTPSGTGTTSFTVPAGFKNLRLTGTVRSSTAATFTTLALQFNSDTGSNYSRQNLATTGSSTPSSGQSTAQTSMVAAYVPAANSLANNAGGFEIWIPDHANTTFHKTFQSHSSGVLNSGSASGLETDILGGFWANTAALTGVTVLLTAGNYVSGSTITLWGEIDAALQSSTAPAVASSGTISTASLAVSRVAPSGAVTGVILQAGTYGGQVVTVLNESTGANSVTFAASGTSNVADGTSDVVAGLTARRYVWDSSTSLWYPSI